MRDAKSSWCIRILGSFVDQFPDVGLPEVAFAGRSNVGKSSALNCLLNRKKAARVSSTPGRTQLITSFEWVRDACLLTFRDMVLRRFRMQSNQTGKA